MVERHFPRVDLEKRFAFVDAAAQEQQWALARGHEGPQLAGARRKRLAAHARHSIAVSHRKAPSPQNAEDQSIPATPGAPTRRWNHRSWSDRMREPAQPDTCDTNLPDAREIHEGAALDPGELHEVEPMGDPAQARAEQEGPLAKVQAHVLARSERGNRPARKLSSAVPQLMPHSVFE
jgi:hypothetical protein